MNITKAQLRQLVEETLIEEEVNSSQATIISNLLTQHIGKGLKLPTSDIIKYIKILNDISKSTSISSKRTQFIKKIVSLNGEAINNDEAFTIVRAIEGMSFFSDILLPNKMKFDMFLKQVFENIDVPITMKTDAELEAEANGETVGEEDSTTK